MNHIRTLLISNERYVIIYNADHSTVYGEMQGIFQQDTHESLLNILTILHNHTKIDLFLGLVFFKETMKHTSIIMIIKTHYTQRRA